MPKCYKLISSFDFLKEYANYPCLWNKCHPKFGDEVSREAACQELTSFLQTDDPNTYIRKLKGIENRYYRELTQSFSVLKSNPNAKLIFKPWVELAKRFFGEVSHNSYEDSISVPHQAENYSSTTESLASTSSRTEIFEKECLNKSKLAARVDESISSQVEDGINNPLNYLHTCIDIKEECNDAVNITENAGFEESNDQYEPSHIKIEEPMDETAMAVNAITAYDQQISQSSEPFIKVICASTNSSIPAHAEEHIVNNTNNKKRFVSSLSSTACTTDEMTEDLQRKVAKKNSSKSSSELTNEFATFGQYIASQMQLLPLSSALKLQCDT